jgi:hypothetical protein
LLQTTHLFFCASARTTMTLRLGAALAQLRAAKGRICCVRAACIVNIQRKSDPRNAAKAQVGFPQAGLPCAEGRIDPGRPFEFRYQDRGGDKFR